MQPKPSASVVYATRVGGKTIDRDAEGGNPFASALIEATANQSHSLGSLLRDAAARTVDLSSGVQQPTWALRPGHSKWKLERWDMEPRERRVALVLVAYDYESTELGFLTGAAFDQRRIAAVFAGLGFSVMQDIGPARGEVVNALQAFAKLSANADAAFIYSTGHGIHQQGDTFLLPCDYPAAEGYATNQVLKAGVPVARLCQACHARSTNVVMFAGCRTTSYR